MSKFEDFMNGVLGGVGDLATDTLGDIPSGAMSDAKAFLAFSADSLETWTDALAKGELSAAEFQDLADDLPDLTALVALSELGIAKTKLQRFRDGLVDLIVSSATKVFSPLP